MPALLLYLLKANVALVVLYGIYFYVLRKLTFYHLNRWYLWGAVIFSALYPLLQLNWVNRPGSTFLPALPTSANYWATYGTVTTPEVGLDYGQIVTYLFWAGLCVVSFRLIIQFVSLYQLHRTSFPAWHQGKPFLQVLDIITPFSFWKNIYLNPSHFSVPELNLVLDHEQVHVRQAHTLDVLLAEMLTALCWYNPIAWKMRQSLKENLEFIADQEVMAAGADRKFYQYALLRAVSPSSSLVVHPFNTIPLKNRIMMMNQPSSSRSQLCKALVGVPLVGLLLLFSQTESWSEIPEKAIFQEATVNQSSQPGQTVLAEEENQQRQRGLTPQQQYEAFLKRNPTVTSLRWANNKILITRTSGKWEEYPSTAAGTAEVEKKYGKLPVPPPPPPPAPEAALAPPPPPPPFRDNLPADFKKRNPTVKGISSDEGSIYVILKSGEVDSFDHTEEGRAAFEKKYGALPPPPPPVRVKEKLPPPPPPVRSKVKFSPPVVKRDETPVQQQKISQDYKDFLTRNPEVDHLYWTVNSFHVVSKSGTNETFPKSPEGIKAAEKKYGKLPAAPAMPPIKDMPVPKKAPERKN